MAGFATVLGASLVLFTKRENKKVLAFALAFAAAIMASLSVIELIPEGYLSLTKSFSVSMSILICLAALLIGCFITIFIEKRVVKVDNHLYKIGLISMIVLILHNFPEGIVTFMAGFTSLSLGITIAFAIAMHNIPDSLKQNVRCHK